MREEDVEVVGEEAREEFDTVLGDFRVVAWFWSLLISSPPDFRM